MIEVGEIFRQYGFQYRESIKIPLHVHKAMVAIEHCRTAYMGGHVEQCSECGVIRISYNSCRNRHCPKCQRLAKEKWLQERIKDLLPIQYYHTVFTIPSELYEVCFYNQKELYDILFKSSSETLKELSRDKKYVGGEIGFISILHTWGQKLSYHPHIHTIVTGGGLSKDERQWIKGKKNFFIPVKVMSRVFRGKFLYYLRREFYKKNLKIKCSNIEFHKVIENIKRKEWVVYCKKPFDNVSRVMAYLGRYTHRIAITNNRIKSLKNDKVTFEYKDYKDKNKIKFMTVDVSEFIRLFLQHILPHRFVKIRHYGLLSNRSRNTKLKKAQILLGVEYFNTTNSDILNLEQYKKCPYCKIGTMIELYELNSRSSPLNKCGQQVI